MPENRDMEDYTGFLAGLALGEQRCLCGKEQPDMLIVREKQLTEEKYVKLFLNLWENVIKYEEARQTEKKTILIPHTYPAAARQAGCGWLQLPMPLFREYKKGKILSGLQVGTSIHSVEEVREAQKMGAAYIVAGHIFTTDCKKGVAPRGLEFLEQVCASVNLPVLAIGGIEEGNISQIQKTSAAGACRMSEYMR